tara:strand:+ start:24119 stop:24799 length:681 start_codon:yes stop_codon:yes gene_type:complete
MKRLWINVKLVILSMRRYWIFIITPLLFSQPQYPADSLLASKSVPLIYKTGLLPIAAWQRLSYNTDLLNCQFYPSCSNYGAEAIKKYGLLRGSALASERIVRCSPFALHYHMETKAPFHAPDGRLIDYVIPDPANKTTKSPLIASLLSSLLPGSGRIYAGRTWDGIMGMWTIYLVGSSAYYSLKDDRPIAGPLFGATALIVYFGEIYGAWRTAKYYEIKGYEDQEL